MFWRARRQAAVINALAQVNLQQASRITHLLETNRQQAIRIEELLRQLAEAKSRLDMQSESESESDERGRLRRWLASRLPSRKTPEELAAENRKWWFEEYLPSKRPTWEQRIKNFLILHPEATWEEAEEKSSQFTKEQAQIEFDKLNQELERGVARSNVITGNTAMVAALVVGLVTILVTQKVTYNLPLLLSAGMLMAFSFVLNIWSMRPPFWRAIMERYIDVADWSVLAVDPFSRWALTVYPCGSRQRIATRYKALHSASITLFSVSVMMLGPIFTWTYIVKFAASVF